VRHALSALRDREVLSKFVTTLAVFPDTPLKFLSGMPGFSELNRRSYSDKLKGLTQTHPWRELLRVGSSKFPILSGFMNSESLSVDSIYRMIDGEVARLLRNEEKYDAVYAYEDGAYQSFGIENSSGLKRIYDLPIGYWRCGRRIQEEEAELKPEWASTMNAVRDSKEKCERKDEELKLSSHVVVASSFTKSSLSEAPFKIPTVEVIPYGCPDPIRPREQLFNERGEKLKALFVGGLSQRKGISYLFDAADRCSDFLDLTVIGRKGVGDVRLERELIKHRYIPSLPHEQILVEMEKHDVFLFPTLFEGFGLVVTEALSRGMVVISTPHSCAPDLIEDHHDGFIVPIRSVDAIVEKLEKLNKDRDLMMVIKNNALELARRVSWESYERKLGNWITESVLGLNPNPR